MSELGSNFDVLTGSVERLAQSRKVIIAMQCKHTTQSTSTTDEAPNKPANKRRRTKLIKKKSKRDQKIADELIVKSKLLELKRAEIDDDLTVFPNGKKVMCYHEGNPLKLYAVRKGKNVQKCVFFHWEDCKKEVIDCDDAVYDTFDDLISAAAFAFSNHDDDGHKSIASALSVEEDNGGICRNNRAAAMKRGFNSDENDSSDEESEPDMDTSDEEFVPNDDESTAGRKRKHPNEKDRSISTRRAKYEIKNNEGELEKLDDAKKHQKKLDDDKRYRERMRDWMPLYNKLKAYYEEHGNCKFKKMYYFIEVQGKMYRKYCERRKHGGEPDAIMEDKIKLLNEINFDFESTKINLKWLDYYEKAKEFRKENPTWTVSNSHELKGWITFQREDFKRLRLGKPNTMTIEKLQKLNEIGFLFNKNEKTVTWEERKVQLIKFKEKHGHMRVPLSNPVLGQYVAGVRKRYWRGEVNPDRVKELNEIGFIWQAAKRHINSDQSNFKSWDERFQEVIEYKRRFGNCLVPQHWKENPTLGGWVAKQRKGYRLRKEGKKCGWLTPERALRLSEIGFVFDYTGGRGRRRGRPHKNTDVENNNNQINGIYDNADSEMEDYAW